MGKWVSLNELIGGFLNHVGESAPVEAVARAGLAHRALWLQPAILAVLIGFLYGHVLLLLVRDWVRDDNYSHGFFVPLFSAYVLWQRRRRLSEIPVAPLWQGLWIILGALATLIVGTLGAELFLSRSSLLLLLAGLVVYFLGWGWYRAVLFPWAFLFLMIPIPSIIFSQITLPLQLLASRLASGFLSLAGVPVLQEGNVIHLPGMVLEVVEACSGIRSLVSLLTLAVIYGYFLERRVFGRVLLCISAMPVAVVANGFRVMGTGLLGYYWNPDKAEGFFHSFSGWIIFVLSLGLLLLLHAAMRAFDGWRRSWRTQ